MKILRDNAVILRIQKRSAATSEKSNNFVVVINRFYFLNSSMKH